MYRWRAMLASGTDVGRYRIETLLGAGGMGAVYRAYDRVLRRRVALKVLRADLPDAAARLLREGRAAAALSHPNAVAIYDVGEAEGVSFIAMELALGRPMRDFIGDATVPIPERIRWLVDLARALSAAHQKGFVHRDIKPDNVMVCADGAVKLLDFGIAKQAGDAPPPSMVMSSEPGSFKTAEGRVTGTPRYMAPEQLRGDPLDARTDEYAWGVVAYELLAGAHPLTLAQAGKQPEMLNQRVPGLPFEVAAVVTRAMAPAPELRFASLEEPISLLARQLATPASITPASTPSTQPLATVAQTVDMSAPGAAIHARVHDAAGGPYFVRLLWPALALVGLAIVATLRTMHFSPLTMGLFHITFYVGLFFVLVRPLLELRREPRLATVSASNGAVHVAGASSWSQSIRPAGASIAAIPQGASLLVARPRTFDPPVRIEVSSVAQAEAILRAAGIGHSPFGVIRWGHRRGLFDALAMGTAVAWRVEWIAVMFLASIDMSRLAAAALLIALVFAVAATALKLASPGPGPHITLGERTIEVKGTVVHWVSGRTTREASLSLPLASIMNVRPCRDGLEIDAQTNERWIVELVPVRWSNRGLTADEIEIVAAHVLAASTRARSGTFDAMIPAVHGAIQGRYGTAS